jgi:hypothetical protein
LELCQVFVFAWERQILDSGTFSLAWNHILAPSTCCSAPFEWRGAAWKLLARMLADTRSRSNAAGVTSSSLGATSPLQRRSRDRERPPQRQLLFGDAEGARPLSRLAPPLSNAGDAESAAPETDGLPTAGDEGAGEAAFPPTWPACAAKEAFVPAS